MKRTHFIGDFIHGSRGGDQGEKLISSLCCSLCCNAYNKVYHNKEPSLKYCCVNGCTFLRQKGQKRNSMTKYEIQYIIFDN